MQLLTDAALIKSTQYLRKYKNTHEMGKKNPFLIFQPENPSSDSISNKTQEYFPDSMTCTVSYGHMQSKSLSWELHKGVF